MKQIRPKDSELFEIKPIILGGSPSDPENKIWLSRQQHFEAVRYWNHMLESMLKSDKHVGNG